MRRLAILIVTLGALLVWGTPGSCPAVPVLDNFFLAAVRAQAQPRAVLYPADASAFPSISPSWMCSMPRAALSAGFSRSK
jgi:hypothetical protein